MNAMSLQETIDYLSATTTQAVTRVILAPAANWTDVRRFFRERGCAEVRLSEIITESAWLPAPDDVFGQMQKPGVLLGLDGYLALLDEANRRSGIEAVKRMVDDSGIDVSPMIVLLKNSAANRALVTEVFSNPRYRMGRQVVEITGAENMHGNTRTTILLVGDEWREFLPSQVETFQSFLRKAEEHPGSESDSQIVVQSDGRRLAGVSAEIRQVMSLRDFAETFYEIRDAWLSEEAVKWLMRHKQDVRSRWFTDGDMEKRILRVFAEKTGAEREAVLWVARKSARAGSYLESVIRQDAVTVENFQSAYVCAPCASGAEERREAILELGVNRAEADIRQFISLSKNKSTVEIVPWLNCGTIAERAELLRRCAADGIVSKAVKTVYPELTAYLSEGPGSAYFAEYRNHKILGTVGNPVCGQRFSSRDSLVQRHTADSACALLVVDAMSAEWLPMLLALANERNIGVESAEIGEVRLPTATRFNPIAWPSERRFPDIKRFDNIAHNGMEVHEMHSAEENLAEQLEVVGVTILPKVAEALTRFERVLMTADHGSSRLAALASRTLAVPDGTEILDARYCRKGCGVCPSELEETLDGGYWVVRGYDRLPKQGGGNGFERHGGGTPEERLVPVFLFSHKGAFTVPKAVVKSVEITENKDFDL